MPKVNIGVKTEQMPPSRTNVQPAPMPSMMSWMTEVTIAASEHLTRLFYGRYNVSQTGILREEDRLTTAVQDEPCLGNQSMRSVWPIFNCPTATQPTNGTLFPSIRHNIVSILKITHRRTGRLAAPPNSPSSATSTHTESPSPSESNYTPSRSSTSLSRLETSTLLPSSTSA